MVCGNQVTVMSGSQVNCFGRSGNDLAWQDGLDPGALASRLCDYVIHQN